MTRNARLSTYTTADDVSSVSSSSDNDDEHDEPSEECEDDRCRGPQLPIWHCVDCDSSYCRYATLPNLPNHFLCSAGGRMTTTCCCSLLYLYLF